MAGKALESTLASYNRDVVPTVKDFKALSLARRHGNSGAIRGHSWSRNKVMVMSIYQHINIDVNQPQRLTNHTGTANAGQM